MCGRLYGLSVVSCCFFFSDSSPTEIYTFPYTTLFRSSAAGGLGGSRRRRRPRRDAVAAARPDDAGWRADRKSTRLNSSHSQISYAVFCLKKKKNKKM